MGLRKLIFDFTNPAMRLAKNVLSHTLKIIFFVTQGLQCNLQEISFKIIPKKSNGRIFLNLENPNFGPFMLKYKYSPNIELH